MKALVVLLSLSLTANIATLAAYLVRPSLAPPGIRDWLDRDGAAKRAAQAHLRAQRAVAAQALAEQARSAAVQAKLWSALASDDLPVLVSRLRAAGFPPSVIRGIVTAEVQKRFSARMGELTRAVADAPYWRPPLTSSYNNPKFFEERQQVYRDRAKLMRELLGPDMYSDSPSDPTGIQRRQFGNLPPAKIEMIQRINDDYTEMQAQVRAAAQGITLPEDREKLALLEREKRADLAAILTPQELEDYEMRTSITAMRLRNTMTWMDATEAEFRTIFRIQQPFDSQLYPPSAGGSMMYTSELMQQRRELTEKMHAQVRQALGDARTADFIRASNYEFQQLAQLAQRENRPMADAVRAYELRDATARESGRIGNDRTLSNEQKLAALRALAQNTRAQLAVALGPMAGEAYAKSATWLQAIERGTIVTFDGTTTSFRSVSTTGSTPPRN